MWVKICGTTNLPDALLAIEHGADALGFIFAPSKRRVTVAQAAAITSQLPSGIERVGVFTSPDLAEVLKTTAEAGLTAVQMHWPYDPALTAELTRKLGPEVRLIQVVGIKVESPELPAEETARANEARLRAAFADQHLWGVLLDTEKDGHSGGLGLAFAWQTIQPVLQLVTAAQVAPELANNLRNAWTHPRLLLAGGLNATNVKEAIGILRPWGVDCVSGVEGEPGHKDPVRLAAFLQAVRSVKGQGVNQPGMI